MKRLVTSFAAADRLAVGRSWLREKASPGDGPPAASWAGAHVVAPTLGAAADLVRETVREGSGPAAGLLGVERWTLPLVAAHLAMAERSLARAPLTPLAAEAVAARAVALCCEQADLEHFAPVAAAPGFPRRLAWTLAELARFEVEPAGLGGLGAAGRDLARLLDAYQAVLAEHRLLDPQTLFEVAAESLAASARGAAAPARFERPLLLVDPAIGEPVDERLLSALAERASDLLVLAPAFAAEAVGRLEELVGVAADPVAPPEADGATPRSTVRLTTLQERLFQPLSSDREQDRPNAADETSFVLLSAPGEARECAELARRARDRAREGVPFDDMALLLRAPESYLPLVEEALGRAGIPAFFSRGARRPHASGRAFLTLLACAAEGASASRFAEYLSLGQVPSSRRGEEGEEPEVPWVAARGAADEEPGEMEEPEGEAAWIPSPRAWERLLVDAAVVGGAERWRRRLAGFDAELAGQDEEASERGEGPRHERRREQLAGLARFALPLVERLLALPAAAPWEEWLDRLEQLAVAALAHPRSVLEVLAELRPMAAVGPVGLASVRQLLEERLSTVTTEGPLYRFGRLFVGTIDEARGRAFDTVLLPGLAEGIFPRRSTEDALLLDADRERLEKGGRPVGLPGRDERVEAERQLLQAAVGAARRQLIASYPSQDLAAGRSRVPSLYALDLVQAADGRLPGLEDLERQAAAAASTTLGWPAPRHPQAALDPAEYDLAVLEPLVRRRRREVKGGGRYLLEVNGPLARSLRSRWHRWSRRFTPADGLMVEPGSPAAPLVESFRLAERVYSATALERFAACPYRFFLASLVGLRPRDAVTSLDRLDPRTRGRLFHRVQHELLTELSQAEELPVGRDELEAALDRLDGVVERCAKQAAEELSPAIPRVWASEIAALRSDLRGWLRAMASEPGDWRPSHFELTFGLAGGPDGQQPVELPDDFTCRARLKGAIDLVEVQETRQTLRVIDHKTGRSPENDSVGVGGGEQLQPLVYSLAAEARLGRPVEEAQLFYCTQRGGYRRLSLRPDERERRRLDEVLRVIDDALAQGFLPAAPREKACDHCDFRPVCGPYEELRVGRKRLDRLGDLAAVRRMP